MHTGTKAFYLTGVNHLSTRPIPNSFILVFCHLFKRPDGGGLAQSRYLKLTEKYFTGVIQMDVESIIIFKLKTLAGSEVHG